MKKCVCFMLCVAIVLGTVMLLGGCSSDEPAAFSPKLRDGKSCYVDVVEIQPDFKDLFIYCKCTLADGTEVWMEVFDNDYKMYFDTDPDEDEYDYMPNGMTYEAPVRLNGTAREVDDVIHGSGKEITVFRFSDADVQDTTNGTLQPLAAADFNRDMKVGKFVCADITGIAYEASVRSTTSSISGVFSVICSCTRTNGEALDILIDISDYQKFIEEGAVFRYDAIDPQYPDPIEFVQPVKIYGITVDTKEEFSNTSLMYNEGILFKFLEADAAQVEAAKVKNQPAVPFSDGLKEKQPVYAEITGVTAEYVTYDILSTIKQEYYICRCETTDGREVWMYILSGVYNAQFLKAYGDPADPTTAIKLKTPLKINGRVCLAESISEDIAATLGVDAVFHFSGIETD